MLTDHVRRESVKRYASVQLEEKRRLLEGKQGRNLRLLLTSSQSSVKNKLKIKTRRDCEWTLQRAMKRLGIKTLRSQKSMLY